MSQPCPWLRYLGSVPRALGYPDASLRALRAARLVAALLAQRTRGDGR
jgi:hypothetical protein